LSAGRMLIVKRVVSPISRAEALLLRGGKIIFRKQGSFLGLIKIHETLPMENPSLSSPMCGRSHYFTIPWGIADGYSASCVSFGRLLSGGQIVIDRRRRAK